MYFVEFIVEHTLANLIPLLIGGILGAIVMQGLAPRSLPSIKAAIVAAPAAAAGLWAYSVYDIPELRLAFWEAVVLLVGMFGLPFSVAWIAFRLLAVRLGRKDVA